MIGSRYQVQWNDGSICSPHETLKGAKIAVALKARRYRVFTCRAVDVQTGETWFFDRVEWKLRRIV